MEICVINALKFVTFAYFKEYFLKLESLKSARRHSLIRRRKIKRSRKPKKLLVRLQTKIYSHGMEPQQKHNLTCKLEGAAFKEVTVEYLDLL